MPVRMSNTSPETACLRLISTKFARSMKKVLVRRTSAYHRKTAICTTNPHDSNQNVTLMGKQNRTTSVPCNRIVI